MALPSFMKHIRVLEESDLVISHKKGRVRICELRPGALTPARGWLEQEQHKWETRWDQRDAFVERPAVKEKTNGKG